MKSNISGNPEDGKYMTAALWAYPYNIYISSNYGATWEQKSPSVISPGPTLNCVSISGTGQYQMIRRTAGNVVQISTNYGVNWTQKIITGAQNTMPWSDGSISHTGQYWMIMSGDSASGGNSQLWQSNDYGATFTLSVSGEIMWYCKMSPDGKYRIITHPGKGAYFLWSDDFGVTWTNKGLATNVYSQISISQDGKYQFVGGKSWSTGTGSMSYDYGATWVNMGFNGELFDGSADGKYLSLANLTTNFNFIGYSNNFGATYVATTNELDITQVSVCGSGKYNIISMNSSTSPFQRLIKSSDYGVTNTALFSGTRFNGCAVNKFSTNI